MTQKAVSKLLQVTFWLIAFSFVFLVQMKNGQLSDPSFYKLSEIILVSLWFIGNFYLFYIWLIPEYLNKNKMKLFVVLCFVYLVVSPFSIDLLLKLNKVIFLIPAGKITLTGISGGILGSFITGGIGASFRIIINLIEVNQRKKELENMNLESEIRLLKARLNPHFLFNTINNIDALITDNQEKASELLAKLSDLLRYVIYDTEAEKFELAREIMIIEKYIELYSIRVAHPENIHFSVKLDSDSVSVPPMLFIPFIENAFKYSNLNKQDQAVYIEISCSGETIYFKCKNNFSSIEKTEGIGLELARKRLELYYPGSFSLETSIEKNVYKVDLTISNHEN